LLKIKSLNFCPRFTYIYREIRKIWLCIRFRGIDSRMLSNIILS